VTSVDARSSQLEARIALRSKYSRVLSVVAALVLGLVVVRGLIASAPDTSLVGEPLPAFDLANLSGDGRVTNEVLAGRVAVINVWASWCAPCREEAPVLRRVSERADPRAVVVFGVAHTDTASDAREFVEEFAIEYPNALDDNSLGRALGVRGLPMTFVVDAQGVVVAKHFGPITETRLTALIEDALARSGV
jgi:cytochrome c biogenesis protein CcmG/thiol:disulfide interchange protein DsbE